MPIFTNQATLSYNNIVTASNVATGRLLEPISVTKTPLDGQYSPNERITYVVSILNSGSTGVAGLTVTDNLGAYPFGAQTLTPLTYVDGTLRYFVNGAAPAVASDSVIVNHTLNPVLSDLAVTLNDQPWAEGTNYDYDPATGIFASRDGQITVPAATYTQDPDTGAWRTEPGGSTLTVTGTV